MKPYSIAGGIMLGVFVGAWLWILLWAFVRWIVS